MLDAKQSSSLISSHNIIPILFSTILAIISIAAYFANSNAKNDITQSRIDAVTRENDNNNKIIQMLLQKEINDPEKLICPTASTSAK